MNSFPVVRRKEKFEKVSEAGLIPYCFSNRKWVLFCAEGASGKMVSGEGRMRFCKEVSDHITLVLHEEGEGDWTPVLSLWKKMKRRIGNHSCSL